MTSAFSWQNSISLCPTLFHIPRPNLPVTPAVSWLPTFAFQSPIMKRTSFLAKVGSQDTPGVTSKFALGVQNKAGQRLIEVCRENILVIASTLFQQLKRRLYTWTSPDGQRWNRIDYILCSQKWRSSIQSAKTRPEADCGSDHELLIAKFRLKLKVGNTTRPFRNDLNQIPYDYTVEVINRFKGFRSDRQSAWRTMNWGS